MTTCLLIQQNLLTPDLFMYFNVVPGDTDEASFAWLPCLYNVELLIPKIY